MIKILICLTALVLDPRNVWGLPVTACSEDSWFLPHESDNTKYYQCENGQMVVKNCRWGTTFSTNSRACLTSSGALEDSCEFYDNGCPVDFDIHLLLPHETSCRKFYFCVRGQRVLRSCASGLVFNFDVQICDYAGNIDRTCEEEVSSEEEIISEEYIEPEEIELLPNGCPANYTISMYLPHEYYCNVYYQCVFGGKVSQRCPDGTHFNQEVQNCDHITTANCQLPGGNLIETTTTTAAPTTPSSPLQPNGCPVDQSKHWLVAHEDCTKFYFCVWGGLIESNCPDGLYFNPVAQYCDNPALAGCATDPCKNKPCSNTSSSTVSTTTSTIEFTMPQTSSSISFTTSPTEVTSPTTANNTSDPTTETPTEPTSSPTTTNTSNSTTDMSTEVTVPTTTIDTSASTTEIPEEATSSSSTIAISNPTTEITTENTTSPTITTSFTTDIPTENPAYSTTIDITDPTTGIPTEATISTTILDTSDSTTNTGSSNTTTSSLSTEFTTITTSEVPAGSTTSTSMPSSTSEGPANFTTSTPVPSTTSEVPANFTTSTAVPSTTSEVPANFTTSTSMPSSTSEGPANFTTSTAVPSTTSEVPANFTTSTPVPSTTSEVPANFTTTTPVPSTTSEGPANFTTSTAVPSTTSEGPANSTTSTAVPSTTSEVPTNFTTSAPVPSTTSEVPANFTSSTAVPSTTSEVPANFTTSSSMPSSTSEGPANFTTSIAVPSTTSEVPANFTTSSAVPSTTSEVPAGSTTSTAVPSSTTIAPTSSTSLTTEDSCEYLDNGCPVDFDMHFLLPHETSCRKFYFCVRGEKILRKCGSGLVFNPDIGNCVHAGSIDRTCEEEVSSEEDVISEENIEPEEIELLPNGCPVNYTISLHLPHEYYCNIYYQCVNGQLVERYCPGNTHFNPTNQICDHIINANCSLPGGENITTTTQAPTETTTKPDLLPNGCPINGSIDWLVGHEDCTKYYVCVWGGLIEMNCPDGTHFNAVEQFCDNPATAGCMVCIKPCCSDNDGDNNCDGNGDTDDDNDSEGEDNDDDDTTDDYEDNNNGENNGENDNEEINESAEVDCDGAENKYECIENKKCVEDCNTLPRAHKDCDKYWICYGKKAILITCAEGLHFNPRTGTCDYPCNAGCVRDKGQATPSNEGLKLFLPWDEIDEEIRSLLERKRYLNQ